VSSINSATISALVNAITGGLTTGQSYDLMRRVSEDLDSVFTTVNSGPLKAVNASALLHINPVNIDSPGDVPPNVTSQGQVAFLNVANNFILNQRISRNYATFETNYNNNEIGRMQSHVANGTFFGNNMNFTGGAWASDTGNPGSAISCFAGGIFFLGFPGAIALRGSIDANGIWNIGAPASLVNAVINDIVLEKQKDIRASNNAATRAVSLIRLDANDLVGLGSDALNTGKGHVAIPWVTAANLPAAAAAVDGVIVQDKTNNRLCFYQNGARYYVAGTAF